MPSDAVGFFGATGDLAYKQIFPALYTMVRDGHLCVPVIGVAGRAWTSAQLRQQAQQSPLLSLVGGDYKDQTIQARLNAIHRSVAL